MEQKTEMMNAFFAERVDACNAREKELEADGRGDEAVFEKIRANVYDIFRTVLSAAGKACKGDTEAVRRFFGGRLAQIPADWGTALENAEAHGDTARAQIERIKLEAAEDIRAYFRQVWEEEA